MHINKKNKEIASNSLLPEEAHADWAKHAGCHDTMWVITRRQLCCNPASLHMLNGLPENCGNHLEKGTLSCCYRDQSGWVAIAPDPEQDWNYHLCPRLTSSALPGWVSRLSPVITDASLHYQRQGERTWRSMICFTSATLYIHSELLMVTHSLWTWCSTMGRYQWYWDCANSTWPHWKNTSTALYLVGNSRLRRQTKQ